MTNSLDCLFRNVLYFLQFTDLLIFLFFYFSVDDVRQRVQSQYSSTVLDSAMAVSIFTRHTYQIGTHQGSALQRNHDDKMHGHSIGSRTTGLPSTKSNIQEQTVQLET